MRSACRPPPSLLSSRAAGISVDVPASASTVGPEDRQASLAVSLHSRLLAAAPTQVVTMITLAAADIAPVVMMSRLSERRSRRSFAPGPCHTVRHAERFDARPGPVGESRRIVAAEQARSWDSDVDCAGAAAVAGSNDRDLWERQRMAPKRPALFVMEVRNGIAGRFVKEPRGLLRYGVQHDT